METRRITVGILAHVDAGKTTLAEGILYLTGSIRKLGRVDHQNAFLDNFEIERSRGITIFSKQAEVMLEELPVTLLDTPGHVDFSAEMERTLQVLDYAVLLVSGADGVQGHVETLWRLLARYEIPVFLFVNKMDQQGTDREALLAEIQKRLDGRCIPFDGPEDEEFLENLAMCDEEVLERYLENGEISLEDKQRLIAERKVFPCYFGSALKMQGVETLLEGIRTYSQSISYPDAFGARVYKITRDSQGARLTHLKITGGSLRVKELLRGKHGEEEWEDKVDQIRIYSGSGYRTVNEAEAGTICAVTGLEKTYAGEGIGGETEAELPLLEPVLSYEIQLPPECDVHQAFLKLRMLEEEEPELHIVWDEQLGEIHAQLMGEVQIEVLKNIIRERFNLWVEFGAGNIVYKETIREAVEGIGHYEPLRHYAEAQLLLEPGERGSGLQFATVCSEDVLDRNWQRLILTHLEEKSHRGVLTGSEITDMRITLLTGRAHLKHTEGGDFRQATYRAVRHGLKSAESILLEPIYEFRLEVPSESVGRAMTDIQKMHGTFQPPQADGDLSIITGTAPVVTMRGYQTELLAYTKGRGRMTCTLKGYEECHNAEEVIAARGYDSEADLDNPTGSVFCAHGAGFVVSWDLVQEYKHLESGWSQLRRGQDSGELHEGLAAGTEMAGNKTDRRIAASTVGGQNQGGQTLHGGIDSENRTRRTGMTGHSCAPGGIDDDELTAIFERTYGPVKRERNQFQYSRRVENFAGNHSVKRKPTEECLLVDGYNIIFAWEDLKELAKVNIEGARGKLMDILSNYQGYKKNHLILVFDAYRVEGGVGSVMKYHNIYVVFTKEAETADQYIEKTVREIGKQYHVTVATSDAMEQVIIMGAGASRMSAAGLWEEIQLTNKELRTEYLGKQTPGGRNYLFNHLPEDMTELMEEVRLGRKTLDGKEIEQRRRAEIPDKPTGKSQKTGKRK